MENRHISNIVRLGPRVPTGSQPIGRMESLIDIAVPNRVVVPRADSTTTSAEATSSCGENACEKPVSESTFTLPIVLGIA